MGEVKNHLLDLIAKQVNEKGIVVWYDPEFAYTQGGFRDGYVFMRFSPDSSYPYLQRHRKSIIA